MVECQQYIYQKRKLEIILNALFWSKSTIRYNTVSKKKFDQLKRVCIIQTYHIFFNWDIF